MSKVQKKQIATSYTAIDLFAGCGGLTQGMHEAGFHTRIAVELEGHATRTYKLNHPNTVVLEKDIRRVKAFEIRKHLDGQVVHLLAGCPPCQGFSSVRKLNKKKSVRDNRNSLVAEYFRIVKEIKPLTIMMENVPGLKDYYLFKQILRKLDKMGYSPKVEIVNVKDYGVPQSRRRLVMVGSLLGIIDVAKGNGKKVTVRDAIGGLKPPRQSTDLLHKVKSYHTDEVLERIRLTPKNGGGWRDLPDGYVLKCHMDASIGFSDIYGRLRWDDYSTTITGGCLNPSKGRFLHPSQNRVISPREASLLQSFPPNYQFPTDIPKSTLALLIGNALPPRFSFFQSLNIVNHLKQKLGDKSDSESVKSIDPLTESPSV